MLVEALACTRTMITIWRSSDTYKSGRRKLAIEHFTLNENAEKRNGPTGVIGKFGVGLKDALATFHRRGVTVTIRSKWGVYHLREATKHDFDAIPYFEGSPANEYGCFSSARA